MAWYGIEKHQQVLDFLRTIYQNRIIEPILISCFGFQAISGILLFFRLRKQPKKSTSDKVQMYSGLILGLFIIQHISATIGQRIQFEFDTNFYFAANVVLKWPLKLYFIPYYFLGVFTLGLHIANTHKIKTSNYIGEKKAKIHFYIITLIFTLIAITILYLLMGGHFPIAIPKQYNV
jgi:hypothetical protein